MTRLRRAGLWRALGRFDMKAARLASRAGLRARYGGYSALARWYRRLRPHWAWERVNPLGRATRRYVEENGLTVQHGPFIGLVYPREAVGTVTYLTAKLLGAYEQELVPVLLNACAFELFVDIGAGDGYYCVGYARLFPQTRVIGYETDASQRQMAVRLAELNEVGLEMRGSADHHALNALPSGRLLLLIDVEGYEYELVDPALVPRLREATMIIETHPTIHSDVIDVLGSRFAHSHDIETITGTPRRVEDHPELVDWADAEARFAITEGRGGAEPLWLVLRPKTPAG